MEICHLLAWIIHILFWISSIPQVLLNFKIRTTRGISDLTLFGYFNGYLTNLFYVYCFNMPRAYKTMIPISFCTILIVIVQRFSYKQGYKDTALLSLYAANALIALFLIPYAIMYPRIVGNITGWITMSIWASYQLPQIAKIHKQKSVFGYSLLLVTLIGIGNCIECVIAFTLHLPLQSKLTCIRGIVILCILLFQFWRYRFKQTIQPALQEQPYQRTQKERQKETGA